MASIIKNQILKHLSKFAKNLSADKINVSTLKGEGELSNLELNEDVLMDVLELPLWIRLTKATCNRVSCKISWTKLKSVPIYLNLDEVLVETETCEELRKQASQTSLPSYSSGGKYGFYDKVIDGMTVTINSVIIKFKSPAFHASFQVSRICLDSRMPNWQVSDLRMTRLKEPLREELLIFKQLEWQTLRVEATATSLQEQFSTPLRLITNQARCRITIKKRIADCSILGSRLALILDDLLWVLTDSQLKAALHFANSLSDLIHKATALGQKTKAVRKLESLPARPSTSLTAPTQRQPHPNHQISTLTKVFNVHDVVETSYHLYSVQIDLHLCDEVSTDEVHLSHPKLSEGGAMQVTFRNVAVDYYPYHLAVGDRKHWIRYKECSTGRSAWVSSLLANFRQRMTEITQGEVSRTHIPVHRTSAQGGSTMPDQRRGSSSTSGAKTALNTYMNRLMAMCIVIRMDDFTVFQVSTSGSPKSTPAKFISSDKGRLLLPSDMTALHLELTQYYYPGDGDIPVPLSHMYVHLNPFQITYDPLTSLWVNSFLLSLQKAQATFRPQQQSQTPGMDIRLEGLMPRLIIQDDSEHVNQPERPKQLQIQVSRLVVTNSRAGEQCGRIELGKCLEVLQQGELFFGSSFPSAPEDFQPVVNAFVQHSLSHDRATASSTSLEDLTLGERRPSKDFTDVVKDLFSKVKKELLWTEMKNIWCVSMDPVWADFSGIELNKNRPVPFMDAIPLTLWVYHKPAASDGTGADKMQVNGDLSPDEMADDDETKHYNCDAQDGHSLREANLHILAHMQSLVNIQITHYQYLFLVRAIDSFSDLAKDLASSTSLIVGKNVKEVSSSCIGALFPEFHVSFVMPVDQPHTIPKVASTQLDLVGNFSKSTESVVTDGLNSPGDFLQNGIKESISDHLALKDAEADGSVTGSLTKSCSDSLLDAHSNSPTGHGSPMMVRSPEMILSQRPTEDEQMTSSGGSTSGYNTLPHSSQGPHMSGPGTPSEWSNLDKMPDNLTRTIRSGSSVMRKGFSNFMSSIDSAIAGGKSSLQGATDRLGTSPDDLSSALDEWETMSVRSDMSSDSDQFMMVHMESQAGRLEDTLFAVHDTSPPKVERASEMKEDSPSEPSSASVKRLDLVSVLTLRFGKVEYLKSSEGNSSTLCLQCNQIGSEEQGIMTWDEFQTQFSARSRSWQEPVINHSLTPCELKLRMEAGLETENLEAPSELITAVARDVNLTLSMRGVMGIPDLIEDETISRPPTAQILLSNIMVKLQEDRPPANVTSPGPVPLTVYIASMTIHRGSDGIVRIETLDKETVDKLTASFPCTPSKSNLRSVLAEYIPQLSVGQKVTVSRAERKNSQVDVELLQMENKILMERLSEATARAECALERLAEFEDELIHLREEKRSLVATRQLLQDELQRLESQQRSNSDHYTNHNATG